MYFTSKFYITFCFDKKKKNREKYLIYHNNTAKLTILKT